MNNKKAQAQIITVVLIILLVLALITIAWRVIRDSVNEGAENIETTKDCIGVDLEITDLSASSISVKRNSGGPDGDISVTVVIDGNAYPENITGLSELETKSSDISASANQRVEIAAHTGEAQCAVIDSGRVP